MNVVVHHQAAYDPGIQLTPAALQHVEQYIAKQQGGIGLRLSIKTTGCSGYSYVIDLIDAPVAGDWVSRITDKIAVYVDEAAVDKVRGTVIDYVKQGLNAHFEFNNPNEQSRCGCGESFSM